MMNHILLVVACFAAYTVNALGNLKWNYDEGKVRQYRLENPLTFTSGEKVATAEDWRRRRKEILETFAREMYGQPPPEPEIAVTELIEEGLTLGGLGLRRQYRMWFRSDKSGPYVDWLVILPNRMRALPPWRRNDRALDVDIGKVPAVLFLNFYGNHELLDDSEVVVPKNIWHRDSKEHGMAGNRIVNPLRGAQRRTWFRYTFPVEVIAARGYAVISACYAQISPDIDVTRGDSESIAYEHGVFRLWPTRDKNRSDNTTALGAWAWALSRGLDLAERIPEIDATKCVATGCSRLGKTALLAAARDERFAVCVPVQTGGGGVPLAKRNFGENVASEVASFPHWFCKAYAKYAGNEDKMPFDQHLLLSAIAPRGLLVLGYNSGWFDPRGEYLSCRAASQVWEFLGRNGLPDGEMPDVYDTSCIGQSLGYWWRGGDHGISAYDWLKLLDFADGVLDIRSKATK